MPGSKSITNRALLLAAMAEGESLIKNCMNSEDAAVFIQALKDLGFEIKESESVKDNERTPYTEITVDNYLEKYYLYLMKFLKEFHYLI